MPEDGKPGVEEFRVRPRTYLIWIAILGLIPLLLIFKQDAAHEAQQLSQHDFMQKVANNLIVHATITLDQQSPYLRDVRGVYLKTDGQGKTVFEREKPIEVPFFAQVYLTDHTLQELLSTEKFSAKRPNMLLINLIWSLGPILLIALLIYFFLIRKLKIAAKQAGAPGQVAEAKEAERVP